MNKLKFALPLLVFAGLTLGGAAFANNPAHPATVAGVKLAHAEQGCEMEHASDVCILNHSGDVAYITIQEFGVEKDEISHSMELMSDYYSEEEFDPIHVTIYDSQMKAVFDETIPNHGPILELVAEKANAKKFSVKFR